MRLQRADEHRSMPWANGRGVTQEVAVGRSDVSSSDVSSSDVSSSDEWHWRISIATVSEDGPFSSLPGTDRLIVVANCDGDGDGEGGDGMVLTVDGNDHVVRFGTPFAFAFSGDAVTSARLVGGTVRDLNLMTVRGRLTGSMTVLQAVPSVPQLIRAEPGVGRSLVAIGGDRVVIVSGGCLIELEPFDALLDVTGDVSVSAGTIAVIDVTAVVDGDGASSWHDTGG